MRKYITFMVSFLLLFLIIFIASQLLYGMFLLPQPIPNINIREVWQEIISSIISESSSPFWLIILAALIAATIAHFISRKLQDTDINH